MNREQLFDKFLQRALSREEAAELKRLLKQDPQAGRDFVQHIEEASLICRVGAQLEQTAPRAADIVPLPTAPPGSAPTAPRPSGFEVEKRKVRWYRVAAWAACIGLLAAVAWLLRPAALPLKATIAVSNGDNTIVRKTHSFPAETGLVLQPDDMIQIAPQARAVIVFEGEATRLELQSGSQAKFITTARARKVELSQGILEAIVGSTLSQRPLILQTLHAETKLAQSRCLLASEISSSRLEVADGAVQFTRRSDGQSLLVRKGFTATASPNVEFAVRPFLPEPWQSKDIGAVRVHGRATSDGETFRLQGAGQDTCCKKDQFHFAYQPLEGDGEIVAMLRDLEFTDPEAKAMVMIRQTLKTSSPQVSLGITAAGGLELEHRSTVDSQIEKPGHAWMPCWLRLVRQGDVISAYYSSNGSDWQPAGTHKNVMPGRIFIGLGVTSYNHAVLSTALFGHVRISNPSATK